MPTMLEAKEGFGDLASEPYRSPFHGQLSFQERLVHPFGERRQLTNSTFGKPGSQQTGLRYQSDSALWENGWNGWGDYGQITILNLRLLLYR